MLKRHKGNNFISENKHFAIKIVATGLFLEKQPYPEAISVYSEV
jgi:hypothetical protein